MSESTTKPRDSVVDLLLQLSRGEKVTAEKLKEANTYYSSVVTELKAYKDVLEINPSAMNHGQYNTEKDNGSLQRQLEQLLSDNSILGKELHYHRRKATQDTEKPNVGHQDDMRKLKEDIENLKRELKTLRANHSTAKDELEHYKNKEMRDRHTEIEHREKDKTMNRLKEDFETVQNGLKTLRTNYSAAVKELEHYKNKEMYDRKTNTDAEQREKEKRVGQELGQSKAMDKLRQQNLQLNEENDKLTDQINELRNRLSILAGHELTDGNPGIADLSDPYRPTNLAERFRQLYDDEWTHAFEDLEKHFTTKEEDLIDILAKILKDVDQFCGTAGIQQFDRLKYYAKLVILEPHQPDGKERQPLKCDSSVEMSKVQDDLTDKLLRDFRKSLGILSTSPLMKIFQILCISQLTWNNKKIPSSRGLNEFLEKTLELVWMMKIQDPPMEFTWSEKGDKFDKNMYTPYTIRGNTVAQCVWPAVVLHRDGPLMSKGVVQGK